MFDAINRAFVRAYVGLKREEGQTFVEYSLIGVLVAVALAAALVTFEGQIATRCRASATRSSNHNSTRWRQVTLSVLTCRQPGGGSR